jgi:hypothetical protein
MFVVGPAFWGGGVRDQYIASVKALLHFNDANGTTVPAVAVGAPTLSNTGTGGNKVTSTSPKFGAGAWASTTANNTGLSVTAATNATTPYTIEFFFKPTAFGAFGRFFAASSTGPGNLFALSCVGGGLYWVDDTGSNVATTGAFTLNVWTHVAICYASSNVRVYLDGVLVFNNSPYSRGMSSTTVSLALCSSVGLNGADAQGVFDEFRWTHGVDRYPSGLTVPTTEFPNS